MMLDELFLGKIVCMLCCFALAYPLYVIGYFGKDSHEPIAFWAGGENHLKSMIKDIAGYNQEMGKIFVSCGHLCCLLGVLCLIHWLVGLAGLGIVSTLGTWFLWKRYQAILQKYS